MESYEILLGLAILFNFRRPRALALIAVVGIGIFTPIPREHFYAWSALVEIIVFVFSFMVGGPKSQAVAFFCVLLIITHFMGYYMDGYHERSYHYMVRIYEHSELLVCMLGSRIRRKTP